MPIITLLSEIQHKKLNLDIATDTMWIKNQKIASFEVSESILWILTEGDHHEISVNIRDFKKIDFDSIVSDAKTSTEMLKCISLLETRKPYNAYLRDSNNKVLLDLLRIK